MPDKLKTPKFRMSYPNLFEKGNMSGKYEVKCLFPEGTDLTELKKLARKTAVEAWGDAIHKKLKSPFHKIDHDDDPEYIGFDYLINIRSGKRVPVFDANTDRIMDPEDIYGGCWGYAIVTCRSYGGGKTGHAPGIIFDMKKVQKIQDDEPFGDSMDDTEEGFDAVEGGSTATVPQEDDWI